MIQIYHEAFPIPGNGTHSPQIAKADPCLWRGPIGAADRTCSDFLAAASTSSPSAASTFRRRSSRNCPSYPNRKPTSVESRFRWGIFCRNSGPQPLELWAQIVETYLAVSNGTTINVHPTGFCWGHQSSWILTSVTTCRPPTCCLSTSTGCKQWPFLVFSAFSGLQPITIKSCYH